MKRFILILLMGVILGFAFAGIDEYYTFNAITGTYTPITGTDAAISSDDIISSAIPLDLPFLMGTTLIQRL